jgi:hypothetical protein
MCSGDGAVPLTPEMRLAITGETLLERLEALAAQLDVVGLELAVTMAAAGPGGDRFAPVHRKMEELLATCTRTLAEAAALAAGEGRRDPSPSPERFVG